ncbi:hypothetical protein C8J57DRAFT_1050873, partial [Mycena rebaudengoi]
DLGVVRAQAPLQNRVSAIFAERLFHLLSFEQQNDLAARLASLLLHKKGAMLFGRQLGSMVRTSTQDDEGMDVFVHSPKSWRTM